MKGFSMVCGYWFVHGDYEARWNEYTVRRITRGVNKNSYNVYLGNGERRQHLGVYTDQSVAMTACRDHAARILEGKGYKVNRTDAS